MPDSFPTNTKASHSRTPNSSTSHSYSSYTTTPYATTAHTGSAYTVASVPTRRSRQVCCAIQLGLVAKLMDY